MFRGYEVGAVDFLMKPVVPEVLLSKVAVFVELHRKSQRLLESEEKLRRLAAHLVTIREEERAHIAREIHDELGQVLTGLKMEVTWLAKRLKEQPLLEDRLDLQPDRLDECRRCARSPPAGPEVTRRHGPGGGDRLAGEGIQKRTGIRCRAKLPPETLKPRSDIATTVFRIFRRS